MPLCRRLYFDSCCAPWLQSRPWLNNSILAVSLQIANFSPGGYSSLSGVPTGSHAPYLSDSSSNPPVGSHGAFQPKVSSLPS